MGRNDFLSSTLFSKERKIRGKKYFHGYIIDQNFYVEDERILVGNLREEFRDMDAERVLLGGSSFLGGLNHWNFDTVLQAVDGPSFSFCHRYEYPQGYKISGLRIGSIGRRRLVSPPYGGKVERTAFFKALLALFKSSEKPETAYLRMLFLNKEKVITPVTFSFQGEELKEKVGEILLKSKGIFSPRSSKWIPLDKSILLEQGLSIGCSEGNLEKFMLGVAKDMEESSYLKRIINNTIYQRWPNDVYKFFSFFGLKISMDSRYFQFSDDCKITKIVPERSRVVGHTYYGNFRNDFETVLVNLASVGSVDFLVLEHLRTEDKWNLLQWRNKKSGGELVREEFEMHIEFDLTNPPSITPP